jgi:hypothetical protein
MTLEVHEPPAAALEQIASNIQNLSRQHSITVFGDEPVPLNRLAATVPHQVFTLGLEDLISDPSLDLARESGWRYLLQRDDRVIASAETTADGVFSHFNEGPFVLATVRAIEAAEQLEEVQKGRFELRLLSIPGVYLMALWLHNLDAGTDLLMPLAPSPENLRSNSPYIVDELLEALVEPGRRILASTPGNAH